MRHLDILWWELTHTPALILILAVWFAFFVGLVVDYIDWLWHYRSE